MKQLRLTTFAFAIAAALLLALPSQAHAAAEGSFSRSLKVSAGDVDLSVKTGSGNITIRTGSGDSVEIHARIHARGGWSGLSGEEKVQRIEANQPIEQSGNSIRIGRIEDHDLRQNVSIDYDITTPARTHLSSETGSGDQHVDGIQAGLRAQTGSGNLTLANLTGEVRGESGSGDIHLDETAAGEVKLETGSGNVVAKGVNGPLTASTGSGDVEVSGDQRGEWTLTAGSGNVRVHFNGEPSFDLDAETDSGSIDANFPITMQGSFRKNRLQGKVRNGGNLVRVRTGSGDIEFQ